MIIKDQQNLYIVYIDLKKHMTECGLWTTMRKYNISAYLVRTIEQLYDNTASAVKMNLSIGE